jgi:hypothetical protein
MDNHGGGKRRGMIAGWYTQVVSLSQQVMRFPSDLSAFLKLPAVSPRERQWFQAHGQCISNLLVSFSNFSPNRVFLFFSAELQFHSTLAWSKCAPLIFP